MARPSVIVPGPKSAGRQPRSVTVAALALGWLSAFAVAAFATDPIGQVTRDEKLAHNLALLLLVTAVGALAVRRDAVGEDRVSVTV